MRSASQHSVSRIGPRFVAVALLAAAACGGARVGGRDTGAAGVRPEQERPGPGVGTRLTEPPGSGGDALVARGTAPTDAEARRLAANELLALALGAPVERALGGLTIGHLLADRLAQAAVASTGTAEGGDDLCSLRLTRAELRSLWPELEAMVGQVSAAPFPAPLGPTLGEFQAALARSVLCERKRSLGIEPACGPIDVAGARLNLEAVLRAIELEPDLAEGVPCRKKMPLRPVQLRATLHETPLAHVPLLVERREAQPVRAETETSGWWRSSSPSLLEAGEVSVRVDLTPWVGPIDDSWPRVGLTVRAREVTLERAAIVARAPVAEPFRESLGGALKSTLSQGVRLTPGEEHALLDTPLASLGPALGQLADRRAGQLDTVFFADAQSEFASRMGANRVWFEARGQVRAYDAWTGQLLGEVSAEVTESGVGEARAEVEALRALGRALGAKLSAAVAEGGRFAPDAPR